MRMRNLTFRIMKRLGLLKLKPVIFVHLQKTAGTSIIKEVRQYYGNNNVISHGDFFLDHDGQRITNDKYAQPEYIQNRFGGIPFLSGHFGYEFAKPFMDSRFSFTFLRNPVERVLSAYYFYKTRNSDQFRHYSLAHQLPLDEFLALGFTDPDIKLHVLNYQVSQLAVGWGGGVHFACNGDELLAMAIKHLGEFSYVGFTETFEKDQEQILKYMGIAKPAVNIKSNANPGRPTFDSLPPSSKNLLLELTVLDRQLYEWAWVRHNSVR
ncbi:hypothetical protein MCAMS1_00149 [biofilm metagenome]